MYDAIKKEIYEKPGKKMGQENDWKKMVKRPDVKPGEPKPTNTDFKKNAIARRIAKMAPKPGTNDKDKAGK